MSTQSLPLSNIINVAVTISPTGSPGPQFNQALVVGPSIPSAGANNRVNLFESLTAVAQSYLTTTPEYLAAEVYFSQEPTPTFLWVGRQILTAIGAVTVSVGGTGYVVGDIVSVVQGGASGGLLQVATVASNGVVTALTLIAGQQGTGYSVATGLVTTGGSGTALTVNITSIGETPLEAVTACRLATPSWYICMFVGTALDSDHLAIAAFVQGASPASMYFLTTSETAVLNNIAGNLLANLQAASYTRTFSVYSTTQGGVFPNNAYACAAPMGYAMGANTGAAGSYFTLMFKTMAGVAFEPLTGAEVNTITGPVNRSTPGLNGNCIVNYNNSSYIILQNGTMASGTFFDIILQTDMLAADMQVSGMNLFTSVPALPITDGGVTQMKNVLAGAMARSQARGFIAPSGTWQGITVGSGNAAITAGDPLPQGYYLYAPPVSTISLAQRAARIMPAITALLITAQAGQSLSVSVFVQQ